MIKLFGSVEDFSLSFSISEQCCISHLVVRLVSDRSPDLLYGHLSTKANFFLADSSSTDSCLNVSKTATSLQRSLSSVPKVAFMERLNSSFISLTNRVLSPLYGGSDFMSSDFAWESRYDA